MPGENSRGLVHLEYQYRSDMHYFHYIVSFILLDYIVT